MVIQTSSDVFAILMQLDGHSSFSADALATILNFGDAATTLSNNDLQMSVSNDRTTLPIQK